MDQHALAVLEFHQVLAVVAAAAGSAPDRRRLQPQQPAAAPDPRGEERRLRIADRLVRERTAEIAELADALAEYDLIAARSDKLEALMTHKKGLMQQLFPAPTEGGA